MKINKYYYIHIHNWQKGWSIGDLFNSLLFLLSEKRTNEKIILLTKTNPYSLFSMRMRGSKTMGKRAW